MWLGGGQAKEEAWSHQIWVPSSERLGPFLSQWSQGSGTPAAEPSEVLLTCQLVLYQGKPSLASSVPCTCATYFLVKFGSNRFFYCHFDGMRSYFYRFQSNLKIHNEVKTNRTFYADIFCRIVLISSAQKIVVL